MRLKQYMEMAENGDTSALMDFTRRLYTTGLTEEDLATAHDRWLYMNVVAPAALRSKERAEAMRRVEEIAQEMPPIVRSVGVMGTLHAMASAMGK